MRLSCREIGNRCCQVGCPPANNSKITETTYPLRMANESANLTRSRGFKVSCGTSRVVDGMTMVTNRPVVAVGHFNLKPPHHSGTFRPEWWHWPGWGAGVKPRCLHFLPNLSGNLAAFRPSVARRDFGCSFYWASTGELLPKRNPECIEIKSLSIF